jgi:AcrR family transcriptional regulator
MKNDPMKVKGDLKQDILRTAYEIIHSEGCDHLSMRNLADHIGYSAPMIYGCFKSKEGIYQELARQGFLFLVKDMQLAKAKEQNSERQMEALWMTYWDFAFRYQEVYQIMFGINTNNFAKGKLNEEGKLIEELVSETIIKLMGNRHVSESTVKVKYLIYWSLVHGLVAINIIKGNLPAQMNKAILSSGISAITGSIVTEAL